MSISRDSTGERPEDARASVCRDPTDSALLLCVRATSDGVSAHTIDGTVPPECGPACVMGVFATGCDEETVRRLAQPIVDVFNGVARTERSSEAPNTYGAYPLKFVSPFVVGELDYDAPDHDFEVTAAEGAWPGSGPAPCLSGGTMIERDAHYAFEAAVGLMTFEVVCAQIAATSAEEG